MTTLAAEPVKFMSHIGLVSLCKREILRFLIVWHQTILPPLISASLFMFIFGLSVGKHIQLTAAELPYLTFIAPGLVTMYLISGSYENTSSSLFISRWHNHIQEVLLSPLSYFEMVLGLLTGGVVRGLMVSVGVFIIASLMTSIQIAHPFWMIFFMVTISIFFACAGLMAALWAKDFGTLSVWNTYLITPLVFLGGVFNPIEMLPVALQRIAVLNPMFYLVNGMRYSILGTEEAPLMASACLSLVLAVAATVFTVHLFRIGYKLRT